MGAEEGLGGMEGVSWGYGVWNATVNPGVSGGGGGHMPFLAARCLSFGSI